MRYAFIFQKFKTVVISLILLGISFSAIAQKKSREIDQWNFRISPYFWFIGFKGTIYKPPVPSLTPELQPPEYDIDISFKEIAAHLKFAIMAAGEYRHNRFVTQFNIASVILDGDAITPLDYILQDVFLHFGYVSGDLTAGHHFIFNDKLEIAAMAGFKYIYFDIKGSTSLVGKVDFAGERDFLWMEPIFATRIKYKPHKRIEIATYSDIGGWIFKDELSWQVIGTANYIVSKWFLVSLGYRVWAVKVDADEALYNGRIKGFIIRLGFQF
jgi:hypothetical protein